MICFYSMYLILKYYPVYMRWLNLYENTMFGLQSKYWGNISLNIWPGKWRWTPGRKTVNISLSSWTRQTGGAGPALISILTFGQTSHLNDSDSQSITYYERDIKYKSASQLVSNCFTMLVTSVEKESITARS